MQENRCGSQLTKEEYAKASHSRKLCNPGNIKNIHGEFITFNTYEEGWTYLKNYIQRACTGQHKAYKPTFTIRQFFEVYAPDGSAIINNYSSFVAKHMGVFPSMKLFEIYKV